MSTDIGLALKDLVEICERFKIEYRIYGSVAFIGTIGEIYREPCDIDVMFDSDKEQILFTQLEKRGYKMQLVSHPMDATFPRPLIEFIKNKQTISPLAVKIANNGLKLPLLFPLPFIQKKSYPQVYLFFSKSMLEKSQYTFESIKFDSFSRETLWIGLDLFMKIIKSFRDKKLENRIKDLNKLSENLNFELIKKIKRENPGLYYNNIPIVSLKYPILLDMIAFIVKIKTKFTKF